LLDELGLPYRDMETLGVRLPVLEGHAEYLRPARFDDRVRIVTTIREKPGARIRIEYEVFLDDTLLTRGYTVHAFMNNQGRAIKPPADMLARLRGAFP
jgi:acyl-CoA thioester hydrolase